MKGRKAKFCHVHGVFSVYLQLQNDSACHLQTSCYISYLLNPSIHSNWLTAIIVVHLLAWDNLRYIDERRSTCTNLIKYAWSILYVVELEYYLCIFKHYSWAQMFQAMKITVIFRQKYQTNLTYIKTLTSKIQKNSVQFKCKYYFTNNKQRADKLF